CSRDQGTRPPTSPQSRITTRHGTSHPSRPSTLGRTRRNIINIFFFSISLFSRFHITFTYTGHSESTLFIHRCPSPLYYCLLHLSVRVPCMHRPSQKKISLS